MLFFRALVLAPLVSVACCLANAQSAAPSFSDVAAQASAARNANDIPKAVERYQQAVQMNPQWPDGWWFLGILQYRTDAYAAAEEALTHFISLTPDATAALALRGLCEFETAEYPKSLEDIQKSLALGAGNKSSNESILRFHEALLLTRTGRFEDALAHYAFFAKAGQANPELLAGIGLAGLREPLLPKEVEPSRLTILMAAGDAGFSLMSGNASAADQAFETFFQHFPSTPNAHYFYGYLLFPADPDRAVAEFKREIEIAPLNAPALAMIAWSSLLNNDPSGALPYAERAAAQAPDSAIAQLTLGKSLVETGQVKSGMDHLQKALRLEPDNLNVHLALARAYSEAGQKEQARNERLLCLQITSSEAVRVAQQ